MADSSVLFPWSSIALDSYLEFLSWSKRHHAPCGDRNLLTGFRVTPRSLAFQPQIKISETGQLDLFPVFQRLADHLKIGVHEFLGLTLVETHVEEKPLGHFRLGQRHLILAALPCMSAPTQRLLPVRIYPRRRQ